MKRPFKTQTDEFDLPSMGATVKVSQFVMGTVVLYVSSNNGHVRHANQRPYLLYKYRSFDKA